MLPHLSFSPSPDFRPAPWPEPSNDAVLPSSRHPLRLVLPRNRRDPIRERHRTLILRAASEVFAANVFAAGRGLSKPNVFGFKAKELPGRCWKAS